MPWKDAETKKLYDIEYDRQNCKRYITKVQISSGIPAAVEKALKVQNISAGSYLREALKEKLIRDGYLEESDPE